MDKEDGEIVPKQVPLKAAKIIASTYTDFNYSEFISMKSKIIGYFSTIGWWTKKHTMYEKVFTINKFSTGYMWMLFYREDKCQIYL